ncbi:MAG: tyrosine-type recombinase/integrase [Pseudomonadota bacterium]
MGKRVAPPGLRKRGDTWYVWKTAYGRRIRESTGTSSLEEAEEYLARRMETVRQQRVFGVKEPRTFREAAIRYLNESTKKTIREDTRQLGYLDPYLGDLPLEAVHMGTLQLFIQDRRSEGTHHKNPKAISNRTINAALQTVRHILNLAAGEWYDESGRPWLDHVPKIKLLSENDKREPYPLSWEEQDRLFAELPAYLRRMALFKVNTGTRDQEVSKLRWEWEYDIPEIGTSVFLIPRERVKNRQDRLVVLNTIAREVVNTARGEHPDYVFTLRGRPLRSIYGRVWRHARCRAGLPEVRVHDLKHTFGRRLRAAGVSFEDRQDLLGHKSTRITTHYSAPEIATLVTAANRVCPEEWQKIGNTTILRKRRHLVSVG